MYGYTARPGQAVGTSTITVTPVPGPETIFFVIERTMVAEVHNLWRVTVGIEGSIGLFDFDEIKLHP